MTDIKPCCLQASHARHHLAYMARMVWPVIEPSHEMKWNWHLDVLCAVLEALDRGEDYIDITVTINGQPRQVQYVIPNTKRIIVNVPFGTMKSVLLSVILNVWVWSRSPDRRFLTAAYTSTNTNRDNNRVRSIITSPWYEEHFGIKLTKSGEERLDTSARGYRIATSIHGMGTGEHPDWLIVDDPNKAEERHYPNQLRATNQIINDTLITRWARNPIVMIVQQRLHQEDASGYFLGDKFDSNWTWICFPMHYDSKRADPLDVRTRDGELLWPSMYDETTVDAMTTALGPLSSGGQLEQNPSLVTGTLFRRDRVSIVSPEDVPRDITECAGWDIAESDPLADGTADPTKCWTCRVKIAYCERINRYYVRHVLWAQLKIVDDLMLNAARVDGVGCAIREGSGSGPATIAARAKLLRGFDYAAAPENTSTGGKLQRADPFRAQWDMGNVSMVAGEWNNRYLDEVTSIPGGRYWDSLDGSSNAFNALVSDNVGAGEGLVWSGRARDQRQPGDDADRRRVIAPQGRQPISDRMINAMLRRGRR